MKTTVKLTAGAVLALALTWAAFSLSRKAEEPVPPLRATMAKAVMLPAKAKTKVPTADRGQPEPELRATVRTGLTALEVTALVELEDLLSREDGSADKALAPLREWAAQNPAGAAQWAAEHLEGAARRRALEEAIAIWAARSPQEALAWLDGQATYEGFEGAYSAALSALAAAGAPAAAAWLQQHPDLASRENWEIVFSHWASTDSPAATAWLRGNFDESMQQALLPTVQAAVAGSSGSDRGASPAVSAPSVPAARPVALPEGTDSLQPVAGEPTE